MPPTPDRLASMNKLFTGGLECLSKYTLPLKSGKKALNQDTVPLGYRHGSVFMQRVTDRVTYGNLVIGGKCRSQVLL